MFDESRRPGRFAQERGTVQNTIFNAYKSPKEEHLLVLVSSVFALSSLPLFVSYYMSNTDDSLQSTQACQQLLPLHRELAARFIE